MKNLTLVVISILLQGIINVHAADDYERASNAAYCVGALNLIAKQFSELPNNEIANQMRTELFAKDTQPRLENYRNYVYGYAQMYPRFKDGAVLMMEQGAKDALLCQQSMSACMAMYNNKPISEAAKLAVACADQKTPICVRYRACISDK